MKLIDLWSSTSGGHHLEALVEEDGEKKIVQKKRPFKPYCYIRADDFKTSYIHNPALQTGSSRNPDFVKIEGQQPDDINEYGQWGDGFKQTAPVETFEADVPYARRVLIDNNLGVDPPDDEDILFFDLEVDHRGEFPEPEDADSKILSIAARDGTGEETYFTSTEEDYPDHKSPERMMLRDFLDLADEYVVVSGYNSLRFDWPYLQNRCSNLGIPFNWDRLVHLDMYGLYKALTWTGAKSFKLEDVAEEEFGKDSFDFVGKDYGLGEDMTQIYDWWQDDPDLLKRYNSTDTEITEQLDDKYNLIDEIYRIAQQSHTLPSTMFYLDNNGQIKMAGGQAVDALILRKAYEKGVVLPDKGKYADTHDFPGGEVLDPIEGLHDNVLTVDFSSMYPNIIRALNLGPNTWIEDPESYDGELIKGAGMVDPEARAAKGGFVPPSEEKSILAEAVEELMDMRFDAKHKKKAAKKGSETYKKWENIDAGLKAILNTMYGVFASPYHRYYQPGMSENVTETGQYMVRVTKRVSEGDVDGVQRVIYGDTDSVILQLSDEGDLVDLAVKVADEVNDQMNKAIVEEMNAVGEYLELDLDDLYSRFFITEKKKRYYGHLIMDGDPREDGEPVSEVTITGFEAIRNNWPDSSSEMQRKLIHAQLFDKETGHIIESYKHQLFTGQLDLDLVERTSLKKQISNYETALPHTRAAEQIRDEYGDEEVRVGDKIPYINYGDDKTDITHAYNGQVAEDFRPNEGYCGDCDDVFWSEEHDHDVAEYPHFRDSHYSHIWDKKFRSAMNRVGVHEMEQTGLGAYA